MKPIILAVAAMGFAVPHAVAAPAADGSRAAVLECIDVKKIGGETICTVQRIRCDASGSLNSHQPPSEWELYRAGSGEYRCRIKG